MSGFLAIQWHKHFRPSRIRVFLLAALLAAGGAVAEGTDALAERAARGDPQAQYALGEKLARGVEMRQDYEAALVWFERAAAADQLDALVLFAIAYELGAPNLHIEKNAETATRWFERAARLGDVRAQLALGMRHVTGDGATVDPELAALWFERGAAQSDTNLQLAVASMFDTGTEGVRQSDAKADEWGKRAANGGHSGAQYWLGSRYEAGKGVRKDLREAYFWFSLAETHQHADAKAKAKRLAKLLDEAEVAELDARVNAWAPNQAQEDSDNQNSP